MNSYKIENDRFIQLNDKKFADFASDNDTYILINSYFIFVRAF